jgi:hypothetical protein
LQLPDEPLDLLIACLRASPGPADITRLRQRILSDAAVLEAVLRAAARRQLTAAVIDGLESKGVVHPRWVASAPDSVRSRLAALRTGLNERRRLLRDGLGEIIGGLNAAGIAPLILKGSVSLMSGEPRWRFQRDIDFAIDPADAARTSRVLSDLGFRAVGRVSTKHHHLTALARPDLPAPVEPHIRLVGRRSGRQLSDAQLLAGARSVEIDGLKLRLLRDDHFLIYGLVHHHFENRGAVFGTISLKGLVEFSHALQSLAGDDIAAMLDALDRAPRLKAAVELWIAASSHLLATPVAASLPVAPTTQARVMALTQRVTMTTPAPSRQVLAEDILASLDVLRRSQGPGGVIANLREVVVTPTLEMVTNRVGGGDLRRLRAAGILDEA